MRIDRATPPARKSSVNDKDPSPTRLLNGSPDPNCTISRTDKQAPVGTRANILNKQPRWAELLNGDGKPT